MPKRPEDQFVGGYRRYQLSDVFDCIIPSSIFSFIDVITFAHFSVYGTPTLVITSTYERRAQYQCGGLPHSLERRNTLGLQPEKR
jgi:hypothetical protein